MREPSPVIYEDCLQLNSEAIPGGFIRYFADGDEEIIHVNRYIVDLFECDNTKEFLELTKGSFRHFVCEEDLGAVENSIWGQVGIQDNLDHVYYRIRTKTGKLVSVVDYGRLIDKSEYTRPIFEVFVARVAPESVTDWLTGLSGMARFHALARMGMSFLANSGQHCVAIAFDIMGMKAFNTRYGRSEGDRLLCALADALRAEFGSEACSRVGEDHFYAFAPEQGVTQKVKSVFSRFASADFEHVPPMRAGLYLCDETDDIVAVGFDRARIACDLDRASVAVPPRLVHRRDEGRGTDSHPRPRMFGPGHRRGMDPSLLPAVVRSTTGKVCEEEALARWVDPSTACCPADSSSPCSRTPPCCTGSTSTSSTASWRTSRRSARRASPSCPSRSTFPTATSCVRGRPRDRHRVRTPPGVPHELLHIEFTESAIHSDPELFMSQVRQLHDAGFEVWMDDFGSGYSSLNVLQRYEFDVVKLDMEFLRGAARDWEKARSIVAGIVQTAKRLGVRSLAEGVETEEQAAFLEGIGCDMLQGYLFSSPQPLDVISQRWFKDWRDFRARPRRGELLEQREPHSASRTSRNTTTDRASRASRSPSSPPVCSSCAMANGMWCATTAPLGEFLERTGIVAKGHSGLRINRVQRGWTTSSSEACTRSEKSGTGS